MSDNPVGRPTVFTPEVISALEEAWMKDMTDAEACFCANISKRALYGYQEQNPDFVHRKELLKNALSLKAKLLIAQEIESMDSGTAKWWLERRRKDEFSLRHEQTAKDGEALMPETIVLRGVKVDNVSQENTVQNAGNSDS